MKRKVPKRFLNTLWPCRKPEKGRPNCYVGIDDENRVKIGVFLGPKTPDGFAFFLDRRLAGLLARGINQCLDDTGRRK